MKDQTAFSTRFACHKDELEWLFMELYHNRKGWISTLYHALNGSVSMQV